MHVALLLFGAMVPAMHGVGSMAPRAHAYPGGQAVQLACVVSPEALPNEPSSHGVGVTAAGPQKPPCLQSSHAVAPRFDWNAPAAQGSQLELPLAAANDPWLHSTDGALAP